MESSSISNDDAAHQDHSPVWDEVDHRVNLDSLRENDEANDVAESLPNANEVQYGIPGPSTLHAPSTRPEVSNPPPPEISYEETWHQSANGGVYRSIAGAGQRLRPCISAFEALKTQQEQEGKSPWDPFVSLDEWELSKWLVLHGVSKSAIDEFPKLRIIRENLDLSFTSHYTLYKRIGELPGGAKWEKEIITLTGNRINRRGHRMKEKLEMWFRNPMDVVKDLLAEPDFKDQLVNEPQETYLDETMVERMYDEMWTGDWWLKIQKLLPYGATLVPLIFSSDKTCLTNVPGDKKAWPIYLTIGNIPKATRRHVSARATVLVGYLPISKYKCCTAGEARQQADHWLFHTCIGKIVKMLENEGREGVEVECSDGWVRRCFPVLGAYVADHPEQCLIACCKQNFCRACKVPANERGENKTWEARTQREAGAEIVAQALGINSVSFLNDGYKPVGCPPFWYSLPHCDIFSSFPPDLLHQSHKGLFKDHVFVWGRETIDDDETLDERFAALPSHASILSFSQGVTSLSQTTGRQHKAMEKSFAPVINGLVRDEFVQAVRVAMEFIWIAGLTTHTTSTLLWLRNTFDQLHKLKGIFIELGARSDFNFPKFHALSHYADSISSRGSVDGYNTEHSERLHIDMAKHAYRASNKRECMGQMTSWRYRIDAVLSRDAFIRWSLSHFPPADTTSTPLPVDKCTFTSHGTTITLPKTPSLASATFTVLETQFRASNFLPALQEFLENERPDLAIRLTEHERFNVFVKANISIDPMADPYARDLNDCLHASPCKPANPEEEPGRFDTILVRKHPESSLEFGMSNHLVARLRVIFKLPTTFEINEPLAYVEWFSPPSDTPDPILNLYRVRRNPQRGQRRSSIIRLLDIRRTCRLLPDFADRTVKCTDNMLDSCNVFFVDRALDEHSFRILY